jgi:hypothetical protein
MILFANNLAISKDPRGAMNMKIEVSNMVHRHTLLLVVKMACDYALAKCWKYLEDRTDGNI